MKLKALFMEEPVDFEKRCRLRILVGKTAAVLGMSQVQVSRLERRALGRLKEILGE